MPGRARTSGWFTGRSERGASLPELAVVMAIVGLVGANGWHALDAMREERAGREAARGVVADIRAMAQESRRLRRALAVEFDLRDRPRWRLIDDGNGNGVTLADIAAGVDRARDWTPVVREGRAVLAVTRDVPSSDGAGVVRAGSAPVVLGAGTRLTVTPRGTASAASLYLAGPRGAMYVVRVLGTTQRIRLSCLAHDDTWSTC